MVLGSWLGAAHQRAELGRSVSALLLQLLQLFAGFGDAEVDAPKLCRCLFDFLLGIVMDGFNAAQQHGDDLIAAPAALTDQ